MGELSLVVEATASRIIIKLNPNPANPDPNPNFD